MTAVWRASRAAVRRRKLQTSVIAVVVLISTATLVLALGLLAAASAPFDQAFAKADGAHLVAVYDRAAVSDTRLAETGRRAGVAASAGPFGEAVVAFKSNAGPNVPHTLTTVGRSDPGGPVDRITVWSGRWARRPGEIVLAAGVHDGTFGLGDQLPVADGSVLTVVGLAFSVSQSADAWVTPDEIVALHATSSQMLYRFADPSTSAVTVTRGLPAGAVLGLQSYLSAKAQATSGAGIFIPFLIAFGVLGLAVAVLIVVNVISGAVVAGTRHIGILKSVGFTPGQVMAVYLVMVSMPALVGTVAGTGLGVVIAGPVLKNAFENFGAGGAAVAPWVEAVSLLGMPLLVLVAAFLPSLRARRLSVTEAIDVGRAHGSSRGLRVQRWLGGTRLPRSVSLGLGLPFARPARSALTLAAVVLGVVTVTFATGLTESVASYENAIQPSATDVVAVFVGDGTFDPAPALSDAQDDAMLRSLPGTSHVAAIAQVSAGVLGETGTANLMVWSGDAGSYDRTILQGRFPRHSGEIAATSRFLHQQGLRVGDSITLSVNGTRAAETIVGDVMGNGAKDLFSADARLAAGVKTDRYLLQVEPGTDQDTYMKAVRAGDPGLRPEARPFGFASGGAILTVGLSVLLTLLLGTVAALGVFNTVVLNTRERQRDLGMLKGIGMVPRQVTAMVVTSMAAIGLVGGLIGVPLGFGLHRLVLPAMLDAAQTDVTGLVLNVFHLPVLVVTGVSGVFIAVLGAYIPARRAGRMTIAEVLQAE